MLLNLAEEPEIAKKMALTTGLKNDLTAEAAAVAAEMAQLKEHFLHQLFQA